MYQVLTFAAGLLSIVSTLAVALVASAWAIKDAS